MAAGSNVLFGLQRATGDGWVEGEGGFSAVCASHVLRVGIEMSPIHPLLNTQMGFGMQAVLGSTNSYCNVIDRECVVLCSN